MTLREAFAFAKAEPPELNTPADAAWRPRWREARAVLVAAGYCPACAGEGERARLAPWTRGNTEEYSGSECYTCEEFFAFGEQFNEYFAAEDGPSDADPGL
jgi:hypothetical protein